MSTNDHEELRLETELEEEDEPRKGRKFCKTLDGLLVDVDSNDNLYVAVRQSLHKVNRVSRSSLSPFKGSRSETDGDTVSMESSIGRFSAIKAFFDKDTGNEDRPRTFDCKLTIMGKLITALGLRRQDLCPGDRHAIESKKQELDANDNVISK